MSYKVTSDISHITLNETDTVTSVLQNVAMILKTRQGTVPLYRDFGLPQKFLDKPQNVAEPMLIAEVKEAIEDFEPRATFIGVEFERNMDGTLKPVVEVEINE